MAIHRSVLGFLCLWCMGHGRRLQKQDEDAVPQQQSEAILSIDAPQSFAEVGHESSRVDDQSTVTPLSKLPLLLLAGSPAAAFTTQMHAMTSNANAHPIVSHRWNPQRAQVPAMSMNTVGGAASDGPESGRWWKPQRSRVLTMSTQEVSSHVPADSSEASEDLDVTSDVPSDSLEASEDLDVTSDVPSGGVLDPQQELLTQVQHLLQLVFGVDRGFIASNADAVAIDAAASKIEANIAADEVDWTNNEVVSKLDGRWRLAYTSAFASGSLGGERPGPPSGGPVTLGTIFQDIQTSQGRLINAIEPLAVKGPGPLFPPIDVNVGLGHEMDLLGKQNVRIIGDGVTIQPAGGLAKLPELDLQLSKLPLFGQVRGLLPLAVQDALYRAGGSSFRVTYMDDETRITRGDRDELRVFVRE